MALLAGWQRIKGSSRYLTPLGEEVSARQYKNARANFFGLPSYSAFERATKLPSYKRFADAYERFNPGEKAGGLASEFTLRYSVVAFDVNGKLRSSDEISNDPNGELAQFLEWIGIRPKGAPWSVGESPK